MFLNQACEAGVTVCKTLMRMCPAIDHELAVSLSITNSIIILSCYITTRKMTLSFPMEKKGREG